MKPVVDQTAWRDALEALPVRQIGDNVIHKDSIGASLLSAIRNIEEARIGDEEEALSHVMSARLDLQSTMLELADKMGVDLHEERD